MKGTMTITADGKTLRCEGNLRFENEREPYIVVRSVAKALGITTPEQIAKLTLILAVPIVDGCEKMNSTKIMMPNKKEE